MLYGIASETRCERLASANRAEHGIDKETLRTDTIRRLSPGLSMTGSATVPEDVASLRKAEHRTTVFVIAHVFTRTVVSREDLLYRRRDFEYVPPVRVNTSAPESDGIFYAAKTTVQTEHVGIIKN